MAKGIKCPNCGEADNYKSHQGAGKGDNIWKRNKKCSSCGTVFQTLEVPIGIVPPKE